MSTTDTERAGAAGGSDSGQHRPLVLSYMYGTELWAFCRPLFARWRIQDRRGDPQTTIPTQMAEFRRRLRQLPPARRETIAKELEGFAITILYELDRRGAPATLAELDGPAEPAEVRE